VGALAFRKKMQGERTLKWMIMNLWRKTGQKNTRPSSEGYGRGITKNQLGGTINLMGRRADAILCALKRKKKARLEKNLRRE